MTLLLHNRVDDPKDDLDVDAGVSRESLCGSTVVQCVTVTAVLR